MIIGIIGGGASGMAAAITAAANKKAQIILFERQSRVGRKLQATGNGRCNLTNMSGLVGRYHGENPDFVLPAFEKMDVDATVQWFQNLGLLTVTEASGKVYPYSDHANSVVDVLRFALERPNITVKTGCEIKKISYNADVFTVVSDDMKYDCDKLIVACGGIAGTKLGGTISGYRLLGKLGHKCTQLRPSLVQLKSDWPLVATLKGVRAQCQITVCKDNAAVRQSVGEIQFTEYGISGPVVFEVSRDVCYGKGKWICKIDFLPHIPDEETLKILFACRGRNLTTDDLLTGVVHNKLGRVLTKSAGITSGEAAATVSDAQLRQLCDCLKRLEISLTEPLGMDNAQVTAGGILTEDFDPRTMESKIVPNLYACGEVLDIDGDCGGFNLQWAWSSGCCAGYHAGKEML